MDNFVCKFAQVLRLYTHQGKIYKHFFTGKLVYFWKKNMISTLEMFLRNAPHLRNVPSFLKYR